MNYKNKNKAGYNPKEHDCIKYNNKYNNINVQSNTVYIEYFHFIAPTLLMWLNSISSARVVLKLKIHFFNNQINSISNESQFFIKNNLKVYWDLIKYKNRSIIISPKCDILVKFYQDDNKREQALL